jgi:hypothetical protein
VREYSQGPLIPGICDIGQEVEKMVKMTKSAALTILSDVQEEKRFWCHDGRYLKSLEEMKDALLEMEDETFLYHSNDTKTDFSNWVKDVIGDEKLSRDLLKCVTKDQAAKAVADRIAWLKSKTV